MVDVRLVRLRQKAPRGLPGKRGRRSAQLVCLKRILRLVDIRCVKGRQKDQENRLTESSTKSYAKMGAIEQTPPQSNKGP